MRSFGGSITGFGSKRFVGGGDTLSQKKVAAGGAALTFTIVKGTNAAGPDSSAGTGTGVGFWDTNGTSGPGTINGVNPGVFNSNAFVNNLVSSSPGFNMNAYMVCVAWQGGGASIPFGALGATNNPCYVIFFSSGAPSSVNASFPNFFTSIKFPTHGTPAGQTFLTASATQFGGRTANQPDGPTYSGMGLTFPTTDTSAQAFNGLSSFTATITI